MFACILASRRTASSTFPTRAKGEGGSATTVARAELGDGGLRNVTTIFEALPRASGGLHFGSRIAFDNAGLSLSPRASGNQMQRRSSSTSCRARSCA